MRAVWQPLHNLVNYEPVYQPFPGLLPFMYTPSGAVLMAPFAWLSLEDAITAGLVVGTACCVAAVALSAALLAPDSSWLRGNRSMYLGAGLLGVGVSHPTFDMLSNVNVTFLVVPFLPACLLLWVRGMHTRAALLLGVSLAIKPLLVPLLIVPLLLRRPRDLATALLVPFLASGVALPFIADRKAFFTDTVPLLFSSRVGALGPNNISLAGVANTLDWPTAVGFALRFVVVALTVAAAAAAWRRSAAVDIRLIETTGLLMAGWFSVGTINQPHYLTLLLPLFLSLLRADSSLRNWVFGVALCIVATRMSFPIIAGTPHENDGVWRAIGLLLVVVAGVKPRVQQAAETSGARRSKAANYYKKRTQTA